MVKKPSLNDHYRHTTAVFYFMPFIFVSRRKVKKPHIQTYARKHTQTQTDKQKDRQKDRPTNRKTESIKYHGNWFSILFSFVDIFVFVK